MDEKLPHRVKKPLKRQRRGLSDGEQPRLKSLEHPLALMALQHVEGSTVLADESKC
jgi:hypothetical protein